MTSYGLDEWFWAMFEPTPTLPNLDFDELSMFWALLKHDCYYMSGLNNKVVGDWLNLVKLIIIILHGMYFMCDLKYT